MKIIRDQANLFFLALGFFSRIPMPHWVEYSPELLNRASRYFGLVGWLVGGLVAIVFVAANSALSTQISLWLAIAASLLLTGAFHEDGLADMVDAFGGGFTLEKKLTIMKDSRLGTYGTAALVMALAGKFLLLFEASPAWLAIVVAYPLSRGLSATFIFDMPYVTDLDASKSKPLANNQSITDLLILGVTLLPTLFFVPPTTMLILLIILFLFRLWFKRFLLQQIGGYTGDCLGAAQQCSELLIYFVLNLAQSPQVVGWMG